MPVTVLEQIVPVPTLDDCLGRLERSIDAWRGGEARYGQAEEICRSTRQAWSAYHNGWLTKRSECTPERTEKLETALEDALALLRVHGPSGEDLDDDQRDRFPKFAVSIARRAEMLRLLLDEGAEAVDVAISGRGSGDS